LEAAAASSTKHLFHPADLLREGIGLALLKFPEIDQLPLDARQFGDMGTVKQVPIGLGAEQAQKKLFLVASEPLHQFSAKPGTRGNQLLQGHGNRCHPGELLREGVCDVLVAGVQNFIGRAVMSGEIYDEAFDHIVRESLGFEQTMDIEEVSRVLAIQSINFTASM
jgi:hypothetical protein